jgi:hypothetical protein
MSSAMKFSDALLVVSRLETRMDDLHSTIGAQCTHYSVKQKQQPSPANALLVKFFVYEREAMLNARVRLATYRNDLLAASAMAAAALDDELRAAESGVTALPFDITDSGDENTVQHIGDMHEADIFRITGHGDTTPESRAA